MTMLTATDLRAAAAALHRCRTLDAADRALEAAFPGPARRCQRWGLWDGWAGRPCCPFVKEGPPSSDREVRDYREAWEAGRRLSVAEVPA